MSVRMYQKSHSASIFTYALDQRCSPIPVRHRTERPTCSNDANDDLDMGDAELYSTDSEEVSETDRGRLSETNALENVARRRFLVMLRGLTLRRERIARCMVFAIDHANAAEDVAEILATSLLLPSTPIPRKMARLYVLSDILFNSTAPVPHAWRYQEAVEPWLVQIFAHFGTILRLLSPKAEALALRDQLITVLHCWEEWSILPAPLLASACTALGPA